QTLLLLRKRLDDARQRFARDVLHDEEDLAVLIDDVDRRHHVRMADARDETRFVDEHVDERAIASEMRVHPFDRDGSFEARAAALAADVHRRHPAARDLAVDSVPADRELRSGHFAPCFVFKMWKYRRAMPDAAAARTTLPP